MEIGSQEVSPGTERIYVCQPSYALGNADSHRAFYIGALGTNSKWAGKTKAVVHGCSLLAHGFNRLWCHALNLQKRGEDIRYFAMLHDDVIPQDGWLDILMDDLLTADADLMAAVVPIKDYQGVTSTAIDDPNDRYVVERRLTLSEASSLPEVFTAAHCGYPDRKLLANTGCWVCRFDRPWRFKVRFTIQDKIDLDNNGDYAAFVAPEDWNFSRDIQDLGGKVACTRRVKLTHAGHLGYSNETVWGSCRWDEALGFKFGHAPINGVRDGWVFPDGIPGWLTRPEGEKLRDLARGKHVLEIGSYYGRSTICMAQVAESVTAVDSFQGDSAIKETDYQKQFEANIRQWRLSDKVAVHAGRMEDVLPTLGGSFDLAFIDGDHAEDSVSRDIRNVMPLLTPDAVLAFHDWNYASVRKAVRRVFPDDGSETVVDNLMYRPLKGAIHGEQYAEPACAKTHCAGVCLDARD